MPALLFQSSIDRPDWWSEQLTTRLPDLEVRIWPDIGDPNDVEFALVWKPPDGLLASLPKLRAIFSLGAGVDHLFKDPLRPDGVPITRVVDSHLTGGMVEFALMHTLRFHRDLHIYEAQQRDRVFRGHHQVLPEERRVGLLGLGVIGKAVAAALKEQRFDVVGWTRTPRKIPGATCFHGRDGLGPFLAGTSILICLLPLTPDTSGILDARLFDQLPRGAFVINLARGGHLVEADLLAAAGQRPHRRRSLGCVRCGAATGRSPVLGAPGDSYHPPMSHRSPTRA